MGDSPVSVLVSEVILKFASIVIQEFDLVWGFKEDVLTLKDYFQQIQSVLEDAEKKRSKTKTVESWLKKLRSESLKMENVFDEVSTEAMLRKLRKELGTKYRVRAFFSSTHNKIMFRSRIAHEVKAIRKKIADIAKQGHELNLTPGDGSVRVTQIDGMGSEMLNRETSSYVHSSNIFGRNEETEMVVEKICNNDVVSLSIRGSNDVVRVYAICGMGGLGKTTLAQLVYNHQRVDQHFEFKCWIHVSKNFQVKELLRGILESLGNSNDAPSWLDALQVSLRKGLQGKRFLVVLDDVWIEDREKPEWEKLHIALTCGAQGSIVMVTTRNETTSKMMATDPELQLKLGDLSEVDSWSLFVKFAFSGERNEEDRKELEPIGKEIVEKCKGLPLAVKTLGGMMSTKTGTREWERVRDSHIWELQENDILPALKLSYDNLHPVLKRCFAYCCMFPKSFEMKKDLLILLWTANGFIPPRGETNWYVLGEEIYNCLVLRSFFQVVDGRYKMHDLMQDLAKNVTKDDCSIIQPDKKVITPEEVLHLSSSCPVFDFSNMDLKSRRSLRSIFLFEVDDYKGSITVTHVFDFVYLRVLYMVNLQSKTLPESICKLKYLKYLNLSRSTIEVLPESIIYLQNLQMLLLEECSNLRNLPEDIRYMKNLRYLNISSSSIKVLPESIVYLQNLQMLLLEECRRLLKLPEGMGNMMNLQHLNIKSCSSLEYLPVGILKGVACVHLTKFPVDKKNGAKIGELEDLNLVERELEITGLEHVEGGLREAKKANLRCKRNLFVLRLQWRYAHSDASKPERIAGDEEILEGFEPNPSLEELKIHGCMGKNLSPSWTISLNNLVTVQFSSCKKCEQIPPFGELPRLKSISLERMDSLKYFHDDDYTKTKLFPALQHLFIISCWELVSLPSNFPALQTLYIHSCGSLVFLPHNIQSFEDLNILEIEECEKLSRRYEKESGVDWPKISHIPKISIKRTLESLSI